MSEEKEVAIVGGGCFWCIETLFSSLDGVYSAISGYSGGHVENPSYEEVCGKQTGHAEVVKIEFNPKLISYQTILNCFFDAHDPTTLDRQGNDVGPQYRSIIFTCNDQQKETALKTIEDLNQSGRFDDPIVTKVEDEVIFHPAEDYHQDYFRNNPEQSYCRYVVRPKVEKFTEMHSDKLKKIQLKQK